MLRRRRQRVAVHDRAPLSVGSHRLLGLGFSPSQLDALVQFVDTVSTDVDCSDVQPQDLMLDSFYVYPASAKPPAPDLVVFVAIGASADVYPGDVADVPLCSDGERAHADYD